jgi:hypothetical protein
MAKNQQGKSNVIEKDRNEMEDEELINTVADNQLPVNRPTTLNIVSR